jgi:hypothetical protein
MSPLRQKRPITEDRPGHGRLTDHANRIGKVPLSASCAVLGYSRLWFALDETRPLACFAGVWTNWTSVRKVKEGETTNEIFAFLTTEPNAEVGAIHPKAMLVILTTPGRNLDDGSSGRGPEDISHRDSIEAVMQALQRQQREAYEREPIPAEPSSACLSPAKTQRKTPESRITANWRQLTIA